MDWSNWGHLLLMSLPCLTLCWQFLYFFFLLWCSCFYPFVKTSALRIGYSNANYILDIHRDCVTPGTGLWRQNVNTTSHFRLVSDQFTCVEGVKRRNSHGPERRHTDQFSILFELIFNKTHYLLIQVVLYLSKTDFKAAAFLCKWQSWVNNHCL